MWSRIRSRVLGAEHVLVQRLAGTVFLIRVVSALLAFGSQVLFARWMGSFQFGIYVYVWTWVMLIGQAIDLGLGTAAQRFIPQYRERGPLALLRGFLSGSRWAALAIAIGIAALAAGGVRVLEPWLEAYMAIPLYLACVIIPAYALANVQEGIARSYDWIGLSMMPVYVARQALMIVLMAAAYFAQLPMTSVTAMIVTGISVWLPTIAQLLTLNRRPRELSRVPRRTTSSIGCSPRCPSSWSEASIPCSPIPTCWFCSTSGHPARSQSITPWSRRSPLSHSSITR
jgi:O-antigen/teichoic acid export membrane protein